MVFSSMIFLWAFLPIVFILDKIAGKSRKLQNILLLAASLLFYAWGEPRYMWLLLVSILANYALGLFMDGIQGQGRRKFILIAGILVNLGILGYYKYFNFFINTLNKIFGRELLSMKDIALPLGVSFFTFQAMTYLIDLYKKKYPAQKNVLNMALYFSFFPKITQGPIEKYRDFEKQLTQRQQSLTLMGEGIRRFVYGLAKKVIIADTLGACVDRIYGLDLGNINGVLAWVAIIFYSLQLYYDFSGYSDMAVGLGKMFGFHLTENFNYPYIASTITDFWRRWHISLTSWFREYLYFPLGGNRKGKVRTYINISIIFYCHRPVARRQLGFYLLGDFPWIFYGPGTSGAWENTGKNKSGEACLYHPGAVRWLDLLPGRGCGADSSISEADVPPLDVYRIRLRRTGACDQQSLFCGCLRYSGLRPAAESGG